ncbi:MAG: hypothetical protein ACQZ2J_10410 [Pseudomonas piscis]|uniref:hypothetical protein n=1 Tax=Pseudomonas piscis TaxID=2614538 RepID=UPI003D2DA798
MLRHPLLDQPYQPTLQSWIACFTGYRMPEALDAELSRYDPNDPDDREQLIRRYCLARDDVRENFRHRQQRVLALQAAVADAHYDFGQAWEPPEDDYEDPQWPSGWPGRVIDSRDFFQRLLRAARELWHDDLARAQLPSLKQCQEIAERDRGSRDWLFSVDNPEAWKAQFGLAATPYELETPGPQFYGERLHLALSGELPRQLLPASWNSSPGPSHCRLVLEILGISELAMSGTRFDGPMRTQLTRLNPGYYVRLEIGFDSVIECVALSVSIAQVKGTQDEKQL